MDLPSENEFRKYVENGGGACPFCGSGDIEGDSYDYEAAQVWQVVHCLACGEEWTDVYELRRVEVWRSGELVMEGGRSC